MNTTNSMISFRHEIGLRFLKFVNILYMVIPFAIAWMIYYDHMTAVQYYWKGDIAIIGIYFLLYCYFGKTYDAFLISHYRIFDIVSYPALLSSSHKCLVMPAATLWKHLRKLITKLLVLIKSSYRITRVHQQKVFFVVFISRSISHRQSL